MPSDKDASSLACVLTIEQSGWISIPVELEAPGLDKLYNGRN